MAIPDFQTLMLPVLEATARGEQRTTSLIATMADLFSLTAEERAALLPSGRQAIIANRVHWALSYLGRAELVERVSRGVYRATDRGRSVLAAPPDRITISFLTRFPEFQARTVGAEAEPVAAPAASAPQTPEDRIKSALADITTDLQAKLLPRLLEMTPEKFEHFVVRLLVAMGYGAEDGAGRVLGRSGDGGVDGVIREDKLGLDVIYVQAKRYAASNIIGPDRIREFSGALDFAGARKGVFITTSRFTPEAIRYAEQLQAKRIVLVDGAKLAALMTEHDVGVRAVSAPFTVKDVDLNFFDAGEPE